jgi:hypothetical protein
MDVIVSGGARIHAYAGEPDLRPYVAASPAENMRVEHLVKPGATAVENPYHFVVIEVDGDRLSLRVCGTGETEYVP